jgi:hypothetical protein
MLIRIVKMSFIPENEQDFIAIFEANKHAIGSFEGCGGVQLVKDIKGGVFFTISHWESEEALQNYRKSQLFTTVWGQTKIYFNARPEAWTTALQ